MSAVPRPAQPPAEGAGATALLTARGMDSFGRANAWHAPALGERQQSDANPDAWAAAGSMTGAGAAADFAADVHRRDGRPTEVRIRSVGGTMTSVGYAGTSRTVRTRPGGSVTLRDLAS